MADTRNTSNDVDLNELIDQSNKLKNKECFESVRDNISDIGLSVAQSLRSTKNDIAETSKEQATEEVVISRGGYPNLNARLDVMGDLLHLLNLFYQERKDTDYIVDSGIDNGMIWEKWSNGIMRISGTVQIKPKAGEPTSTEVVFPRPFHDGEYIVTQGPGTSVPGTRVTGTGITRGGPTKMTVYLTRTDTTQTLVYFNVTGIWKPFEATEKEKNFSTVDRLIEEQFEMLRMISAQEVMEDEVEESE